jgi:hypothetical protein
MPGYAPRRPKCHAQRRPRRRGCAGAEIPDATVELWPDATHSLPVEETAHLDRAILASMASHDG